MDARRQQVVLFQRFAHLYDAGVPLAEALRNAARELPAAASRVVEGVVEDLYRGSSLADALAGCGGSFGGDVVDVMRAGERRGELAEAARRVAAGLEGRVLEPLDATEEEAERFLEEVAGSRVVHLDPGPGEGRVRVREGGRLMVRGPVPARRLCSALARRAGVPGDGGAGAFFWRDQVVRLSLLATPEGPSMVLVLSGPPGPEPAEAVAWREGPPGLLVVAGPRGDSKDAVLRAVLRSFPEEATKRVAVDLPAPEAVSAPSLAEAAAQDPDVLAVGRLRSPAEARILTEAVEDGVRALAGLDAAPEVARRRLEAWLPDGLPVVVVSA